MSAPIENLNLRRRQLPADSLIRLLNAEQTNRSRVEETDEELGLFFAPHKINHKDTWEFNIINTSSINRRPQILTEPQTITIDQDHNSRTFQLTAIDANPTDTLTWNKQSGPSWVTINSNSGLITITPSTSITPNTYSFVFRVRDTGNLTDTITIKVKMRLANRAPVLRAIGNKQGIVNQPVRINLYATDPDSDFLSYSKDGPGSLNSETGEYSFTPTTAGTTTVEFTVNDGRGLSDSETITITSVTRSSPPPTLFRIGNRSVVKNNTLTIRLAAYDPENGTITFSRSGTKGTISGNIFTWRPTTAQTHEITFTATSSFDNATASETITITVLNQADANTLYAPNITITSPANNSQISSSFTYIRVNARRYNGQTISLYNLTYSQNKDSWFRAENPPTKFKSGTISTRNDGSPHGHTIGTYKTASNSSTTRWASGTIITITISYTDTVGGNQYTGSANLNLRV